MGKSLSFESDPRVEILSPLAVQLHKFSIIMFLCCLIFTMEVQWSCQPYGVVVRIK